MKKFILLFLTSAVLQQSLLAQDKPDQEKNRKNTVRVNLTNPLIFGDRSIILGYERVTKPNQSFSVNFGLTSFPKLGILGSDSLKANKDVENGGINFSADYRFYLAKENKYPAPRGVYIGPYYSFNSFKRTNSWSVKSSNGSPQQVVESELKLNVHTIGFEMGYQFIFKDRITLDMVLFGPGLGFYNMKATIGGNLSEADKIKFYEKLNDALAEKFPGYGLVVDEEGFKKTGVEKKSTFGYRYMIQFGFRF